MKISGIKKIAITGDVLRPGHNMGSGDQTGNIRWLAALVGHQMFEATGIQPRSYDNDSVFDYAAAYAEQPGGASHAAWAALYSKAPPRLAETWARAFEGCLVVGFEMPPSMRHVLDEHGIPYVDIMLHPVRFMDDVFFSMRSNVADISGVIQSSAMEERLVWRGAASIKAFFARRPSGLLKDNYTLYAAQTAVDRSMISEGRFLRAEDLVPGVLKTLGTRDRICYKDHPNGSTPAIREAVTSCAGSLELSAANIYAHLSNPYLDEVVSVSSSVGTEAIYFGSRSSFVIGPSTPVLYAGDPDDSISYWSVYDAFLAPDFWRKALASIMPTSALDNDLPLHRPDLLRTTLGAFWGYNEIFCDTVVKQSSAFSKVDEMAYAIRMMKALESLVESKVGRLARGMVRRLRSLADGMR